MKTKEKKRQHAELPRSELVYREIQKWINEGEFHPGERLREATVCERLGVSRTPVREAIRRLQAEGRVIIEAQRGAVIAELQAQEMIELYTVRIELEGFAAGLAAQHASDAEIRLMKTLLEESRTMDDDPRALNENNWRLHRTIHIAAHNRFLLQTFDALSNSLALLRGAKYIPKGRPETLFREHEKIVEAIQKRDIEAARSATEAHVRRAFEIHLMVNIDDHAPNQSAGFA
ncbi:GntR family transcriptional regulator [Aliiroseovarius sediminis]|uniref:GntR family transcriptional regulator n=1 Tax=Aliiroseovarius sediminis TaxID=2925839 RepID=UPI001F5AF712|nr:GntR family transcriptional regulator [Aliiroseovarius sediminis]MCI2395027.1 GntR family transcriptional regulator [Aliiroseovarius sediminis]